MGYKAPTEDGNNSSSVTRFDAPLLSRTRRTLPLLRPSPRPSFEAKAPPEVLTVKSAIASWMVDIVDETVTTSTTDQKRFPIPRSISLDILTHWLDECDKFHGHTSHSPNTPSTRIEEITRDGLLRAINTSTGSIAPLSWDSSFVALSYVWGVAVEQHKSLESKPVSAYAPTIRDAAYIAKGMGYQWLWVDRICIDQTNEEEKAILIPYIKDIFAAAQVTIVAASGDGAHSGLPGSIGTPRDTDMITELQIGSQKAPLRVTPATRSFNTLYDSCVWRTRGWTLEEQVFSRRLLYVFDTELIFSCSQGVYRESRGCAFASKPAGSTWAESGSSPPIIAAELYAKLHSSPPAGLTYNLITAREFVRATEEYTGRRLTFEKDRVAAFAGLIAAATSPADSVPERALLKHGHPIRFFETALTWQYEHEIWHHDQESSSIRPRFHAIKTRIMSYRKKTGKKNTWIANADVPSWSWASAGTKVHFLDNGDEDARCDLFRFQLLNGSDILGLPTRPFIAKRLGLGFPDNIIQRQPWLRDAFSRDLPAYSASPHIQSVPAQPSTDGDSENLPSLHLVTIVFDAFIQATTDGQHNIWALGRHMEFSVSGRWSVSPSNTYLNQRSGPAQTMRFAVIGGNWHVKIYIMILEPQATGSNIFSRAGLIRFSEYGSQPLFDVMSRGSPRWDHICIV
ncbi:heterokaryon incompatibility protein [Apiospora sp. TS-2023a]